MATFHKAHLRCVRQAWSLSMATIVGMTLASKATDNFAGREIIAGGRFGEVYANCFTFA